MNTLERKIFNLIAEEPGTNVWERLGPRVTHQQRAEALRGLQQKNLVLLYGDADRVERYKLTAYGASQYVLGRMTETSCEYVEKDDGYGVHINPVPGLIGSVVKVGTKWEATPSYAVPAEDRVAGTPSSTRKAAVEEMCAIIRKKLE